MNYTGVFTEAVKGFWDRRTLQQQTKQLQGTVDQGNRGAVTGGKQMDGFALKITELLIGQHVTADAIHVSKGLTVVPGFFRPTKTYDFLVVVNGVLKAAIELKSQVGPSFGNNYNNRVEEAMGSALDIWTAYREGAFGMNPAPWVGYLMLLEDCAASRKPVRVTEPHVPVLPEFQNSTYAERYELFCRRMIRERHYNAACFLLGDQSKVNDQPNYSEPATDLTAETFLTQLLSHVAPP
jgi:hypothetical protein